MCKICSDIEGLDQANALIEIGVAMEEALTDKQLDHLSELLDKVLGVDQPIPSDAEADEDWERSHR